MKKDNFKTPNETFENPGTAVPVDGQPETAFELIKNTEPITFSPQPKVITVILKLHKAFQNTAIWKVTVKTRTSRKKNSKTAAGIPCRR